MGSSGLSSSGGRAATMPADIPPLKAPEVLPSPKVSPGSFADEAFPSHLFAVDTLLFRSQSRSPQYPPLSPVPLPPLPRSLEQVKRSAIQRDASKGP